MTSIKPGDVPKPPRVAMLDVDDRGYPIFYIIQPPEGRTVHFRVENYEHVLKCGTRKLCGVCGQGLDYRIWFLGSRRDVEEREFAGAPMHRECMDYSLLVCPFLAGRVTPKHQDLGPQYAPSPLVKAERLPEMGLYCTRSFTVSVVRGQPIFKVAPATAIEWRTTEVPDGHS